MNNARQTTSVYDSFFAVARQLKRLAHQSAAEVGLTVHQLDILRHIVKRPGLTQKEVTERLRVPKSRVSLHIDTLVEQGLVLREPSPQDRRETLLTSTAVGAALSERYEQEDLAHRALDAALDAFSPEEVELLLAMHKKLLQKL